MTTSDDHHAAFNAFRQIVEVRFAPNIRDFAFDDGEANYHFPEMWIAFRNATTEVSVHFEFGSGLWIMVHRVALYKKQRSTGEGYNLDDLLAFRSPHAARSMRSSTFDSDQIAELLEAKGAALRAHGSDVLAGDFAVFAQLKDVYAKRRASLDREMENI